MPGRQVGEPTDSCSAVQKLQGLFDVTDTCIQVGLPSGEILSSVDFLLHWECRTAVVLRCIRQGAVADPPQCPLTG
jgi:hypothetical protein